MPGSVGSWPLRLQLKRAPRKRALSSAHLPHPHLEGTQLQLRRQILGRFIPVRPREYCSRRIRLE